MPYLPNNCRRSDMAVHPANWETKEASLKDKWYVHYRFYDLGKLDEFPNGKQIIIKDGVNRLKTLTERRNKIRSIIRNELDLLNEGVNPIAFTDILPGSVDESIPGNTGFIHALNKAAREKECGHKTKLDVDSMLKYFTLAACALGIDRKPVNMIKFKDINLVLKKVIKDRKLSNARFNKYRTYLMMLYTELLECGAVDHNPIRDIRKKQEAVKIRETLTREERQQVKEYLHKKGQHRFALYVELFFHSGIRSTEMLALKARDVNVTDQVIKCTVKKGRQVTELYKTIKNIAVPLWTEALAGCRPDDHIFSRKLMPGPVPIDAAQINRRWKRHIKDGLGIDKDFYPLKHANTTEMVDDHGPEVPADLNSHTSKAMVVKIYDVKRYGRSHEAIKNAGNEF